MAHHRRQEIVRVQPLEMRRDLAEVVREQHSSQVRVARPILRAPALCKVVDAVAVGGLEGFRVEIVMRG